MLRSLYTIPRSMPVLRVIPARSYATISPYSNIPLKVVDPLASVKGRQPSRVEKDVKLRAKYPYLESPKLRIYPKEETIFRSNNMSDETLVRGKKGGLYKSPGDPHHHLLIDRTLEEGRLNRIGLDFNNPNIVPMVRRKIQLPDGSVIYYSQARGSRKSAAAVASLKEGTGVITINGLPLREYFPRFSSREMIIEPFLVTRTLAEFDVAAQVMGGGKSGQAGALQLAVARALQYWNPEHRGQLRAAELLTRDNRKVERKKYGQKKARKKFQWVKR